MNNNFNISDYNKSNWVPSFNISEVKNTDEKNNESNSQFDFPTDEELNALFDNSEDIDFQAVFSKTLNTTPIFDFPDKETEFHMATKKWDKEMVTRLIDLYPESKVFYDEIICKDIAKILKEEFPYTTIDFFNTPNYTLKHFCQIDMKFRHYFDKSDRVENLCTRVENIYGGRQMTQKMMKKICKLKDEKKTSKYIAKEINSEFYTSISESKLNIAYNQFKENVELAKKKILQTRNNNIHSSNNSFNIANSILDLNNNSSNISIEKNKTESILENLPFEKIFNNKRKREITNNTLEKQIPKKAKNN